VLFDDHDSFAVMASGNFHTSNKDERNEFTAGAVYTSDLLIFFYNAPTTAQ
jgi:hypothetical protein